MSKQANQQHHDISKNDANLQTIDELLRSRSKYYPDIPIIAYPITGVQYEDFTAEQLDQFAFHAAQKYATQIPPRNSSSQKPSVIGLLGPSDLDYLITMLALSKLGHTVLFLSTRISEEAVISLLENTSSRHLVASSAFLDAGVKLREKVDGLQVLRRVERDEYALPIEREKDTQITKALDARQEYNHCAWIIHSSGSTGLPKPIFQSHRAALSNYAGNMNMKGFVTLPLYHNHGISSTFRAVYSRKQIHLYNANLPLAKKHLMTIMREHSFEIFYGVPYVLKLLAEEEEGIRLLARCQVVMFGGSACPDELGDKLVDAGINLISHWGATETGQLMTSFRPAGDRAWNYLRPSKEVLPFLKFEDRGEGLYEAVCLSGWPAKVVSNRPDDSYAMKDLFVKHPTLENAWKYHGRLDDTITLVNGEKAIPLPLEGVARQHRYIQEAVVFGAGKDCLGIALIRSSESNEASDAKVINDVLSTMESAQSKMPNYATITRDMVMILPETTIYPRTDKGTVIRQAFYKQFAAEIDAMYSISESESGSLVLTEPELREFLKKSITEILSVSLDDEQDFFSAGMDSLKATLLRSVIVKNIQTNGRDVGINVAFDFPTIASLAKHLGSFQHDGPKTEAVAVEGVMEKLIEEYGTFPKHVPTERTSTGKVIVLTGATGSLAAHIAAQLAVRTDVTRVYCLVRAKTSEDATARVQKSLGDRKVYQQLTPDQQSKLIALPSDFSRSDLGLEASTLQQIRCEITTLIHSAWQVNFNLNLSSFVQDCISGVQNLINLCLSATGPTPASFNFCSSISTVVRSTNPTITETLPPLTSAQEMGYAQSKLVTEYICQRAATQTNIQARTLRIGQIIGDTQNGIWNATEAIPMMLQTALTIGALPSLDEHLRWLPVDIVANTCLDIALNPDAPSRVYNIVNPHTLHWTRDLLPVIREFGIEFRTLDQRAWVAELRGSNPDPVVNPPIKLQEFFAAKYDREGKRRELDWVTEEASKWSATLERVERPGREVLTRNLRFLRECCWEKR